MNDPNDKKKNVDANVPLSIKARISEPYLMQEFVQDLAHRCTGARNPHKTLLPGYRLVESFTLDVPVSGDLFLCTYAGAINKPFHTQFVFTCIQGNHNDYKLTWISSLS
jgi:hypothetical protein